MNCIDRIRGMALARAKVSHVLDWSIEAVFSKDCPCGFKDLDKLSQAELACLKQCYYALVLRVGAEMYPEMVHQPPNLVLPEEDDDDLDE